MALWTKKLGCSEIIQPKYANCFQTTWKPFLQFLGLIGIPTDTLGFRFPNALFVGLGFGLNVIAHSAQCILTGRAVASVLSKSSASNSTTLATLVSVVINDFADAFQSVSIHAATLALAKGKWKILESKNADLKYFLNVNIHKKIRRLSIVGIGIAVLLESMEVLSTMSYILRTTGVSLSTILLTCSVALVGIYRISGIMWAALCLLTIANYFSLLRSFIESKGPHVDAFTLSRWKQFYSMLSEYVIVTNDCFGKVILFNISCIFVRIIVTTFMAVQGSYRLLVNQSLNSLVLVIQLLIILAVAERLYYESRLVLFALKRSNFTSRKVWIQACNMMNQIYYSPPIVNACGLYDVSYRILPKLVGTAVTYWAILYENHLPALK